MKRINIKENGIYVVIDINEEGGVKLLHFAAVPFREEDIVSDTIKKQAFNLVEINISGLDKPYERHGNKYIVTAPGYRMVYEGHQDYRNEIGRKLEITTRDQGTGIQVTTHLQFYNAISVARFWNVVLNTGQKTRTLEYISSFNYTGIEKEGILPRDQKISLKIPHHSWQREMNWHTYSLPELGIGQVQKTVEQRSSNLIDITNTGNWSSKCYLPMGYMENVETKTSLFWQIEHNGSWHWEIGDQNGHLYLNISGPDELHSHWYQELGQNESFETVKVAVGVTSQGFDDAMGELTKYRRAIRRKNEDNENLKVIFNDYMNCLWGKPTTQEEMPMIDAAAQAGCEYYCIDAGWYADGDWWDSVGLWQESTKRFPNGLKEVTSYIIEKGMVPGVWLEIEVMGIHCPKVKEVDKSWFFIRHGEPVFDRSRYQLDFRNPKVREYADAVIDRLVRDYQIGYIKMDYNIEPGIGTELDSDSMGAGLLEHERSYLEWLDKVFERHPQLVIENCSSGGLRMDYAMLQRYSIQSTSDQDDYRKYAVIAANAPAALTPEQAAVWSYPLMEKDEEEVIFNMVNAILLRIHQSGHLAKLSTTRSRLVREAISYYKTIRHDIKRALPIWPLGLADYENPWLALGLKTEEKIYLAVWRRGKSEDTKLIPLHVKGKEVKEVKCVYPSYEACTYRWHSDSQQLAVKMEHEYMARLFEISLK